MQITNNLHAFIWQSMTANNCNAYFIDGPIRVLIDPGHQALFDHVELGLRDLGLKTEDIDLVICTHAHPDHIGSGPSIVRRTGCRTAAHAQAVPWIEDVDLQFKERPLSNFYDLVKGSFKIDRIIEDGDTLEWGEKLHLEVIHTPGHSKDSVSLFLREDGVLFSADAVPVAGDLPIYEDVPELVASIQKLKSLQGVKVLCSSWNRPQRNHHIRAYMDESLDYIQKIHGIVRQIVKTSPTVSPRDLCAEVLKKLGLPDASNKKNVVTSIEAHRVCSHLENVVIK